MCSTTEKLMEDKEDLLIKSANVMSWGLCRHWPVAERGRQEAPPPPEFNRIRALSVLQSYLLFHTCPRQYFALDWSAKSQKRRILTKHCQRIVERTMNSAKDFFPFLRQNVKY